MNVKKHCSQHKSALIFLGVVGQNTLETLYLSFPFCYSPDAYASLANERSVWWQELWAECDWQEWLHRSSSGDACLMESWGEEMDEWTVQGKPPPFSELRTAVVDDDCFLISLLLYKLDNFMYLQRSGLALNSHCIHLWGVPYKLFT